MSIRIVTGDICAFQGDAVVNAANNLGLGGGGVDGAIHRAAGSRLRDACTDLPVVPGLKGLREGMRPTDFVRIPTGSARVTPGFDLQAPWIIHTAGPVWPTDPDALTFMVRTDPLASLAGMQMKFGAIEVRAGDVASRALRDCYKMPALVAVGMGLKSIAYPAISTGVYGCPQETCAQIALQWAQYYREWPLDVTFYIFPELPNLAIWQAMAEKLGVELAP